MVGRGSNESSPGPRDKVRVGIFLFLMIGGIVLSYSSLTATGNVVSNLSGTVKGSGGFFLFLFGLVGLAFNLWK